MEPTQPWRGHWKLSFFTVWTGQQFSAIGSRTAQFALVWWLTQSTGSATVLATASMVVLIPEILFGPIAGAYVDRLNRRLVMMVADSIIALAALSLACLFWMDVMEIWHVYVIMGVRAVGGSFHSPAMQASTSLMVPQEHLTRVAGFNQTMRGSLNILGPPLGALLLGVLPLHGVMLIDVGTALPAIVSLFFVSVPQPARIDPGEGKKPSLWIDLRQGWRYIQGWPGLMALIGLALIIKMVLPPAYALLPLLVSQHFGVGATEYSILLATAGVGFVGGGLVLSVWGGFRRKMYTVTLGVAGLGLCFMVLGITPHGLFGMALASTFTLGLLTPLIDGSFMAILQSKVAPEIQGRVFTLTFSLMGITAPLGLALAGPISDGLGLQVGYMMAGLLCAMTALAILFVPAVAHIEENAHGQWSTPSCLQGRG